MIPPEDLGSFPDGMRPAPRSSQADEGDSVIVAFYDPNPVADGWALQVRLGDGAILCRWSIQGSPRVTCPEFMMAGCEVKLIFTTAVEGMTAEMRRITKGAGTIYIADTPFRTMPPPPRLVPVF